MPHTMERPHLLKLDNWIASLAEILAWYERAVYKGHTLKKTKDGWFLVVRADIKGQAMVAYLPGRDPESCFWLLAYDIKHAQVRWKPDKYA